MSYNRTRWHISEEILTNGNQNDQTDHQTHNKVHYLKDY